MTEALIWDIVRWAVFIALGIFLCVLIFRLVSAFLFAMARSGIWLETHWGGLGGGLSGWRASNAVVYLFLIAFLLGCLVLAAVTLPPSPKNSDTRGTDKEVPTEKAVASRTEQNGKEKELDKGNQKSDAAADDNQKKDADVKKDDPCGKKVIKPTKTSPKTAPASSGCSVIPSLTPTATPAPATPTRSPEH